MVGRPVAEQEAPHAGAGGKRNRISIRSVSKTFTAKGKSPDVHALDDVSVEVRDGEFLTLLGPSGCGKSTLLKIIAGLVEPTAGEVVIQPKEEGGERGKQELGLMFQSAVLLPWRTITDNVLLPADISGTRSQLTDRAHELLELVGLGEFGDRYPRELSGGMQQRASLVRALVNDPSVLLMDEPFGALDAMTRDQMNMELTKVWESTKKTVVFVTHSIQEAVFLSDRIVLMSARPGRVAEVFEPNLPRPRSVDIIADEAFGQMVLEIRNSLERQGA